MEQKFISISRRLMLKFYNHKFINNAKISICMRNENVKKGSLVKK